MAQVGLDGESVVVADQDRAAMQHRHLVVCHVHDPRIRGVLLGDRVDVAHSRDPGSDVQDGGRAARRGSAPSGPKARHPWSAGRPATGREPRRRRGRRRSCVTPGGSHHGRYSAPSALAGRGRHRCLRGPHPAARARMGRGAMLSIRTGAVQAVEGRRCGGCHWEVTSWAELGSEPGYAHTGKAGSSLPVLGKCGSQPGHRQPLARAPGPNANSVLSNP